jgi:hypothetical protein
MAETELGNRMIEVAERDRLPVDHPLRLLAKEFNEAVESGDSRRLLGSWAKARRAWCDYTGEPLI